MMIKVKQILGLEEALNTSQRLQAYNAALSDNDSDLEADLAKSVWTKYSAYRFEVTDWKFDVAEAPTGSSILIDVHKNGTSILDNPIEISALQHISKPAELSNEPTGFMIGDLIEIYIRQVGSTNPGKGLSMDPIGILLPD